MPTDKITAAAGAAAVVTVLAWCLELAGLNMPPAVQTSAAVALVVLAGWLKTERHALAALVARKRGRHAGH